MHDRPPIFPAVATASVCAGPLFLIALGFAEAWRILPQPLVIGAAEAMQLVAVAPVAVIVGCLIAFVPNVCGTVMMAHLSQHSAAARAPEAWIAAGIAAGALISMLADSEPQTRFALVATSAACAAICRSLVRLD